MVEGAAQAIAAVGSTISGYFPAVLGVVAVVTGLRGVLNFVRSAG